MATTIVEWEPYKRDMDRLKELKDRLAKLEAAAREVIEDATPFENDEDWTAVNVDLIRKLSDVAASSPALGTEETK